MAREPWIVEPFELTPHQERRMAAALAAFDARCAALNAGASVEEVQDMEWTITVHDPRGEEVFHL